jgi:hypothetical protein
VLLWLEAAHTKGNSSSSKGSMLTLAKRFFAFSAIPIGKPNTPEHSFAHSTWNRVTCLDLCFIIIILFHAAFNLSSGYKLRLALSSFPAL